MLFSKENVPFCILTNWYIRVESSLAGKIPDKNSWYTSWCLLVTQDS